MEIVWEIVINILEKFLFYKFLSKRLEAESKYKSIIGIVLLCVLETFLNLEQIGTNLTVVLLSMADIIYVNVAYEGSFTQKVCNACMEPIITIIANALTVGLISITVFTGVEKLLVLSQSRFIMTSIYIIFCAVLYMGVSMIQIRKSYLPNYLNILMLFVLVVGVVTLNQMLVVAMTIESTGVSAHILFASACILGIVLLMFYIFDKIGRVTYEKTQLEVENRQYQMEISHVMAVQDSIRAIREWKHDYKQHIIVIRQLLQEENYEALKAYFIKIQVEQKEMEELIVSGNTAVDALLSNKFMIAKSHHIKIDYEIALSTGLQIRDVDFCIILGNALDNAIEACDKLENDHDRYIQLVMKPKRDMFYISVTNSSDGKYQYSGRKLMTTKGESDHGIGVKRIEHLVDLNHGFCTFEAGKDYFTVTVVLPCYLA